MENFPNPIFRRKWLVFLLCIMIHPGVAKSQPQNPGLICISDCATCPIICSSAPPRTAAEVTSPPPPPPPSALTSGPYYIPSPPLSFGPALTLPPPPPPLPPSSYISWHGATPAPPSYYFDNPATQTPAGGGLGRINYSYPYFYYYASKGAFLSFHSYNVILVFLMLMYVFYSCS